MTRRKFALTSFAALLGTSTLTALALRPQDNGKGYSPYFKNLNHDLQQLGIAKPTFIIDKTQLLKNCENFKQAFASEKALRLVVKSLPSVPLLKLLSDTLNTQRFMVFHQPFINQIAVAFPNADLLLGKPMPVQAAKQFYTTWQSDKDAGNTTFEPSQQLQWLIDSKARLQQYLELAKARQQMLNINIEIDVGLHRGGLTDPKQLDGLMTLIKNNPTHLRFSGFMGYDAHVGKLPDVVESVDDSLKASQRLYQGFIDHAQTHFAELIPDNVCYNGAGSPTVFLHQSDSPLNDLSAGSAFVKPTDFDLPTLTAMQPALYLATPVLKVMKGLNLPTPDSLSWVSRLWQGYDANRRYTFFIYGGKWMATPVSPEGLINNALYGVSTNQEMLNASSDLGLQPDDLIFYRPTQSEAVLLQFGDLALWDSDKKTIEWLEILS